MLILSWLLSRKKLLPAQKKYSAWDKWYAREDTPEVVACVAGGISFACVWGKAASKFQNAPSIFHMTLQLLCQHFDRADDPAGYTG